MQGLLALVPCALPVPSNFKNVHGIMHAPLGDDYFNVMGSMLEREHHFTPVTASIVERHVLARGFQEKVEPAAIFGSQRERHVGKRFKIPCGVIAAPIHIQDFPVGYRLFLGYEGTRQPVDLIYNSFTLGMEDHLLEIFGGHDTKEVIYKGLSADSDLTWTADGLAELDKIPGFVRGKVKRNTENFAREQGIREIPWKSSMPLKFHPWNLHEPDRCGV